MFQWTYSFFVSSFINRRLITLAPQITSLLPISWRSFANYRCKFKIKELFLFFQNKFNQMQGEINIPSTNCSNINILSFLLPSSNTFKRSVMYCNDYFQNEVGNVCHDASLNSNTSSNREDLTLDSLIFSLDWKRLIPYITLSISICCSCCSFWNAHSAASICPIAHEWCMKLSLSVITAAALSSKHCSLALAVSFPYVYDSCAGREVSHDLLVFFLFYLTSWFEIVNSLRFSRKQKQIRSEFCF